MYTPHIHIGCQICICGVYFRYKEDTMSSSYHKKLFKHGGSMAVNLPAEGVRQLESDNVHIEVRQDGIFIPFESSLDNMESDPLFDNFIQAVYRSAMENPDQLKGVSEVWDKEWDELLEGVDGGEEE